MEKFRNIIDTNIEFNKLELIPVDITGYTKELKSK
jgi:hypothetical protein